MRKILLQILSFSFIFMGIFALVRFLMIKNLTNESENSLMVYVYGLGHDMRTFSAIFLPLFLCGLFSYISLVFKDRKYHAMGGVIAKFYIYLSSFYVAFIAFVVLISAFIHYYYFQLYASKIDIFIFGLKDDNTKAILSIVFSDYPIIKALLVAIIFSIFCFYLNIKILSLKLETIKVKLVFFVLLNILLIYAYIVALRGHFTYNALRASSYEFSTIKAFNEISTNPLMAFSWAYKEYKNQQEFKSVDIKQLNQLEEKLFPMFDTTLTHQNHAKNHIYINIMESFGLNLAEFSTENINLLGNLKKHFEQDIIFTRFLSSANNTIESFNRLIFLSPNIISNGLYQKEKLAFTPLQIYKNAGYKIVFVYSGNASWYNLGNYFKNQGVDEIIDENTLMQDFPQARKTKHKYGIADEFMYKKIYSIFENAKNPTLVISLSISTHRPYIHKSKTQLIDENALDEKILNQFIISDSIGALNAYAYANDEFGKFLDRIKESSLRENIIVAATGDHRFRDTKMDIKSQKAFAYSVPFYLYIPKYLKNDIYYDKNRVGSHKDIFPTLYNLTLSNTKYLSLGGRNMLAPIKNEKLEFGFNELVWIDQNGVYDGNNGYYFENNTSIKDTNKAFELDLYHKNFSKKYKELFQKQLNYRLVNLKTSNDSD
ncbi:phosphoglycerol transferase [Campylobacter lari]|uniref:LTA synthase family protein n=1 Tax=Campylobacter lari TaxID=201 RepID=UPI0021522C9E|nr:sulfatase-like hydrolase/transferase [Campylobacter lari]MCR6511397.1 sulfatase-like hydrolase/transferase [Campylobacter lari]